MKIRAATLAGGKQNQDAYILGDNFAGVFDGASNHLAPPGHEKDTIKYVNILSQAVKDRLPAARTLASATRAAIDVASNQFQGHPDACPTSTVALARWSDQHVETFVLGDSTIVLCGQCEHEITDDRISAIGADIRLAYRKALRCGQGFDSTHAKRLQHLQRLQAERRNRAGGYWIAGNDSQAAHHGLAQTWDRCDISSLILGTDGGLAPRNYGLLGTWDDLREVDLEELLLAATALERTDQGGSEWPRSKRSDDKTLVHISLRDDGCDDNLNKG